MIVTITKRTVEGEKEQYLNTNCITEILQAEAPAADGSPLWELHLVRGDPVQVSEHDKNHVLAMSRRNR